jgi:hypothetical protein
MVKNQKKAKGVPKQTVKKQINYNMYKETLEDAECKRNNVTFNTLRSDKHQIHAVACCKSGLSNYENKRYYLSNNESLPYGHYLCNQ